MADANDRKAAAALGYMNADIDNSDEFFQGLWQFNPVSWVCNATGNPAITLPLHWNAAGLPIGGDTRRLRRGSDAVPVSAQPEVAAPWRHRHPFVSAWNL